MRSFAFNHITIPVAFKATRCSRRARLWNRQASIIKDLTTLALRHGWHSLPISVPVLVMPPQASWGSGTLRLQTQSRLLIIG
jgi:hypothetical protein